VPGRGSLSTSSRAGQASSNECHTFERPQARQNEQWSRSVPRRSPELTPPTDIARFAHPGHSAGVAGFSTVEASDLERIPADVDDFVATLDWWTSRYSHRPGAASGQRGCSRRRPRHPAPCNK
jgi:hypothetical protein